VAQNKFTVYSLQFSFFACSMHAFSTIVCSKQHVLRDASHFGEVVASNAGLGIKNAKTKSFILGRKKA
jgi:hypothetical protein